MKKRKKIIRILDGFLLCNSLLYKLTQLEEMEVNSNFFYF